MANEEAQKVVGQAVKNIAGSVLHQLPQTVDVLGGPLFLVHREVNNSLRTACLDFVKTQKDVIPKLNVFVLSYGGYPDVAYNSINILRSKCKELVAYIPDYAKSAATLFCLGADEIVMATGAHLGPLDMQVQDPRNSTEMVSALSGYQALEAVANFLHNELDFTAKYLLSKAGTNVVDSLSYAIKLVDSMAGPLFKQVNPLDLGRFTTSLTVSEQYGKELLCRYKRMPEELADSIVKKLVRSYPSHSFVIDQMEAEKIGLSARSPNADEIYILDEIHKRILESPSLQKHGFFKY